MTRRYSKKFTFRIDEETYRKLRSISEMDLKSMSDFLREIIVERYNLEIDSIPEESLGEVRKLQT